MKFLDPLRLTNKMPVVLQARTSECGLACLAMVAAFYGHCVDLRTLRRSARMSGRGATLRSLLGAAAELGLAGRALRCEPDELAGVARPAVLHWDLGHFVVLRRVRRQTYWIVDPALGERRLSTAQMARHFSGVAIELWPNESFQPRGTNTRLRFRDLLGRARGLVGALALIACLSIVLQALVLIAPLHVQVVVDQAILRGDQQLLAILAAAFCALALTAVAVECLRRLVVLELGNRLALRIGGRLFEHLLHLPLGWFRARATGDVVSRFNSHQPVQNAFTEVVVTALVDGALALATAVLMLWYSVLLAGVVFAVVVVYAAIRLAFYPPLRNASLELVVAQARQDSHFIESIEAIATIQSYRAQDERLGHWHARFADTLNRSATVARLEIGMRTVHGTLFGVENVLVVWLAARGVLAGDLTVGMLFAFVSYKLHFTGRAGALVDRIIELKGLSVHLERLGELMLEPAVRRQVDSPAKPSATAMLDQSAAGSTAARPAMTLAEVGFRHAADEPWILRGANLTIREGQLVVIVGRSGSGKSTLLNLLQGHLQAEEGTIQVSRGAVVCVGQADRLLSGTIAENIAFFDPDESFERVARAAGHAGVHDEIAGLPMGYETPVGDLGEIVSSGQRQRILLARGLYRRPEVLLLDEATAHLDPTAVERTAAMVAGLSMTRVVVTHDLRFLKHADQVWRVGAGRLEQLELEDLGVHRGQLDDTDGV